ncbi:MAG: acyloxyacyl hydrolase, partial [Bacteroidota bacterium]
SYSLPVSVFLQLGLAFNYRISKYAGINASANYLHISNGGIRNPNKGINWPTASIGFNYQLNDAEFKKQKYKPVKNFNKYNRFDIGIYSSGKSGEIEGNNFYLVPGIFGAYHRRINNLHSFGIIADFHLDYSLAALQKNLNNSENFYFPSIALGHEYLIGRFNFWQQIGYYVISPDERFMNWYHRWGLNYALTNNLSLGMSLKAHAQVAHFADLRLCYNWKY